MFKNLFKKECKHEWRLTELSNVFQYDDMGYPLMLCIKKCEKCGASKQEWLDVGKNALKNKDAVICRWKRIQ